jgi:hypothetical protein
MASGEELAAAVQRRRVLEMVLVALSSLVVILGLVVVVVAGVVERIGWAIMRPSADSSTGLEPDPRPAQ